MDPVWRPDCVILLSYQSAVPLGEEFPFKWQKRRPNENIEISGCHMEFRYHFILAVCSIFAISAPGYCLTLEMNRSDTITERAAFAGEFEQFGGAGLVLDVSEDFLTVSNISREGSGLLFRGLDNPFSRDFYFEAAGFFQAEFNPASGGVGVLAPGIFGENYAAWYIGRENGSGNTLTAGIITGSPESRTTAYILPTVTLDANIEHTFSVSYDAETGTADFGIDGDVIFGGVERTSLFSDPGRTPGIYLPGTVSTAFIGTGFYSRVFYTDEFPSGGPTEPIPEPASLLLLGSGVLLLKRRRRALRGSF